MKSTLQEEKPRDNFEVSPVSPFPPPTVTMRSTRHWALLAATLVAFVASCVDGDAPASLDGGTEALRT